MTTKKDKKLAALTKQNRDAKRKLPLVAGLFNANRFGPMVFLLVFMAGGGAFIFKSGASPLQNQPVAAGQQILYITPAKQPLGQQQNLVATVWTDSRDVPVNAVQAVIRYPTDKLSYISSESSSSQFDVEAESSNTPGRVLLARGSTKPLTGKQVVATIVFKPVSNAKGEAELTLDSASQLLSSNTNANILSR